MSFADKLFVKMCTDILEEGTSTENQKVRPHWKDDDSPAYTLKRFGVVNRYDLRREFPAITLRKTALKSAMDEILWIYQKKSNNIHDLNSHIWDSWADDSGSIGKAYGYQVAKMVSTVSSYTPGHILSNKSDFSNETVKQVQKTIEREVILRDVNGVEPAYATEVKICRSSDQMDYVLRELKENPFSRRIMISLWNVDELHQMNLEPCCWSINFNVTMDEKENKPILNMTLNQRSSDVLVANNWNVCQYAILLMMVAQVSDMIPGQLLHVITDAHIYDRHIPIVERLILNKEYDAPVVKLNPDIHDFYDFTTDDLIVENYKYSEFNYTIPVAV